MRLGGPVFTDTQDPEIYVQKVREAGYRACYTPDFVDGTDQTVTAAFREACKKADVVIAEVGAWCNPLSPDEAEARKNEAYIVKRLALAEELGAACCVNIMGSTDPQCWSGGHADNFSQDFYDRSVEVYRRIIDQVNPERTKYTFEIFLFTPVDGVDGYESYLKAIDRKAAAVHFDPANCIVCPRQYFNNAVVIRDFIKRLGDKIASCHMKDLMIDKRAITTRIDEVRIGTGEMDYGAWLRELSELAPDLPIMLEHLTSEEDYRLAAEHIRGKAREQGLSV